MSFVAPNDGIVYVPPQELLKGRNVIALNANESPYELPVPPITIENINRYKQSTNDELRQAIAAEHDVHEEQIILGNGSSHLIEAFMGLFARGDGTGVATTDPTYLQYKILAARRDRAYKTVPLDSQFRLDPEHFVKEADESPLWVIGNPNNPTGVYEDTIETLRPMLDKRRHGGKTLIDEAYIEFAGQERSTAIDIIEATTDDVIAVRTFSKAHAAAAIRMGYAVTGKNLAKYINQRLGLYSTGSAHEMIAMHLINQRELMQEKVIEVILMRDKLEEDLQQLGCQVVPNYGNFILFEPKPPHMAGDVYTALLDEHNIAVRSMTDQQSVAHMLRVTVGTPEQNALFLAALKEIFGREPQA